MNPKSLLLFVSAVLLSLAPACTGNVPPAGDPLEGTSWELESYAGTPVLEGTTLTAAFRDGRLSGSSGCNSYGGAYRVQGQDLEVEDLFATLMACLGPEGILDQEARFLALLGEARDFELAGGRLTILASGGEALVFVPAD